jgi:hypothetical protein
MIDTQEIDAIFEPVRARRRPRGTEHWGEAYFQEWRAQPFFKRYHLVWPEKVNWSAVGTAVFIAGIPLFRDITEHGSTSLASGLRLLLAHLK